MIIGLTLAHVSPSPQTSRANPQFYTLKSLVRGLQKGFLRNPSSPSYDEGFDSRLSLRCIRGTWWGGVGGGRFAMLA